MREAEILTESDLVMTAGYGMKRNRGASQLLDLFAEDARDLAAFDLQYDHAGIDDHFAVQGFVLLYPARGPEGVTARIRDKRCTGTGG